MLGIDIYRYQTVTDWEAVRRHGVGFVYVKGTDGGSPAIVRADAQVRGADSVSIPVGLYHYAQLSPSPEAQADVLAKEVRRLGATDLPPALDLEDPHTPGPVARDFALRFIARMRNQGFPRVTLYANTSMLTGIGGPDIDDDLDIVIWAASYGPNDGRRHPLRYAGRVDIHQYTSVGRVPGIDGVVDLNESLTDAPEREEDDMISDQDFVKLWYSPVITLNPNTPQAQPMSGAAVLQAMALFLRDQAPELLDRAREQADDEPNILAALAGAGLGTPEAFAAVLAPLLGPLVQAGATEEQVRTQMDAALSVAFARAAGNGGGTDG